MNLHRAYSTSDGKTLLVPEKELSYFGGSNWGVKYPEQSICVKYNRDDPNCPVWATNALDEFGEISYDDTANGWVLFLEEGLHEFSNAFSPDKPGFAYRHPQDGLVRHEPLSEEERNMLSEFARDEMIDEMKMYIELVLVSRVMRRE